MQALIRFAISGGLATLTHVTVFVLLVEWLQLRPLYASVPAFLSAVGVSYGMNYHWTFGADGPHRVMAARYLLVALSGLLLNLLITWLVVDVGHHWYGYALAAIVVLVPLVTFSLSKMWVFKMRAEQEPPKTEPK